MAADVTNSIRLAKGITSEIDAVLGPPETGLPSERQLVVPMSLVRGTRGYIEKVANQINGTYEHGWYDASAVMIRRLLETLIIEAFEAHKIADRIKGPSGDFLFLRDMIEKALKEQTWNLGRNCKAALPRLKDVGDKSAHSRRFIAQVSDVQQLLPEIRVVVQELLFLAALSK
ncbi:DUF4145 domain-containing protein [Mesorhizobium sp. LNJC405B00]|uniref:DUF4145 domain-containing protein n=1 Tax=unclassified Mesorhizobium TaxID=325217 RepID=UPI0004CF8C69|nr:DUF4145 domain-containing protein [Mesorhizobium sp. LNJC405B00]